nr:MAG TPA: hypothetical protein [Caudoviricetes sp.]
MCLFPDKSGVVFTSLAAKRKLVYRNKQTMKLLDTKKSH